MILGKRTRIRLDGSSIIKITLNEEAFNETRVKAISELYKQLTNKQLEFSFGK